MKNTLQIIAKESLNIIKHCSVIFIVAAMFLPFLTLAVKALFWIAVKTWNLI